MIVKCRTMHVLKKPPKANSTSFTQIGLKCLLSTVFVMDAFGKNKSFKESGSFGTMLNGKPKYRRLIIRRKQ